MTEKRFTHQQIYDGISEHEQFYDNHKRMRYDEVCDKLNEQDERIQQLEESLGFCRDLLDGTCNSTRMKQLHEAITEMVTDD